MRNIIVSLVLMFGLIFGPLAGLAQAAENHGAVLSWTASPSAAGCLATSTPACTNPGYQIYEGPGPGQEGTTPLNPALLTVLTYTDDGPTMNAYLGTTRCYVVAFQETIGTVVTQVKAPEACATWPAAPQPPGAVVIVTH